MIKKLNTLLIIAAFMMFALSGCKGETTTVTYCSDSGELIRLDVSDKNDFYQDGEHPFSIYKHGKAYLTGAFGPAGILDFFENYNLSDDSIEEVDKFERDGNQYIIYRLQYRDLDTSMGKSIFETLFTAQDDNPLSNSRATVKDENGNLIYTEYNVLIKVADTDVSVVTTSQGTEQELRDALDAMTFSFIGLSGDTDSSCNGIDQDS